MHNELKNYDIIIRGILCKDFLPPKFTSEELESEFFPEKTTDPDSPAEENQKELMKEKISIAGKFLSEDAPINRLDAKKTIQEVRGERSLLWRGRDVPAKSPLCSQTKTGADALSTNISPETRFRRQPDHHVDNAPEEPSSGTQKMRMADIDFRALAEQYAREAPDKEPGAFLRAVQRSLERYKARSPRNVPPPTPEELADLFEGERC